MRASSEPQCAMARSVISTSIANTVSCRGQTSWKHQRRSQFSSVYYIIKLPQLYLSIPVLHFITCREKHRSSGVHSPVASIRWATSCSDRGKQIKQWTVIWGRHVSKKLAHLEDHCILPQFTLISIYCSSLALSYIYIYIKPAAFFQDSIIMNTCSLTFGPLPWLIFLWTCPRLTLFIFFPISLSVSFSVSLPPPMPHEMQAPNKQIFVCSILYHYCLEQHLVHKRCSNKYLLDEFIQYLT